MLQSIVQSFDEGLWNIRRIWYQVSFYLPDVVINLYTVFQAL